MALNPDMGSKTYLECLANCGVKHRIDIRKLITESIFLAPSEAPKSMIE